MASGAGDPRLIARFIGSLQDVRIAMSYDKTLADLQPKRRTQRQWVASLAPFHLQRFQVFPEHRCNRLRGNVCRVVLSLPFLCANLTRVHTFLQPSIGQCRCPIRPAPRLSMILLAELLSVPRTNHLAFGSQQNRHTFDSCVELRLGNTQTARALRPTSAFEQVDAMEKMSTRRALPGKHASSVTAVGVHAWCLHVPLLRDHLHEPFGSVMKRATSFTACCTSTRGRHAARSRRCTPEHRCPVLFNLCEHLRCPLLHFTAGVVTDFTFAPFRFICASKISRWRGSASISIWFRDPDSHTQVTSRFRIVTVLSSPSSGPRIVRLLRINPSLSRDSAQANCIESPVRMKSSPCTNQIFRADAPLAPSFPHQRFGEQEHHALERSHRRKGSWHGWVPAFEFCPAQSRSVLWSLSISCPLLTTFVGITRIQLPSNQSLSQSQSPSSGPSTQPTQTSSCDSRPVHLGCSTVGPTLR